MVAGCGGAAAPAASARPAPADLLAAAASVLGSVSSFHVTGMYDPGLSVDLTVSGGDVHGTVTTHGVTWEEVGIAGHAFVRSSALWAATLPGRAAALDDRWVATDDPSAGFGEVALAAAIRRALTVIVFGSHPGLVDAGTVTVDGQRAIELRDATDIYDIAAGATPYPLRWLDRDNTTAGGQPCGVTLSGFGDPVTITAPVATAAVTAPPSPAPH